MPWLAPVIGGVASLVGGISGAGAQSDARQQSKEAYEQSVRDLEAIGIPTAEAQQMTMEQYQSQGQWTPELQQAVSLGDTALGGVNTDPAYKQAQMQALGKLQDIGNNGGMTLEDRANSERVQGGIDAKERGSREAILQRAQQSGGYGSGTSLVAQLMNQQNASNQAHQVGLDTEASAQKRALDALTQGGSLASNLRSQDYGEQSNAAAARDAIAKWNAANQQGVQGQNTALTNDAAQKNLLAQQQLSNANVDTRNKNQAYNKGLIQQQYNNQLELAKAKANARAGQAQNATAGGNAAAATAAGVGNAINQGATAYGNYANNQDATAAYKDRTAALMQGSPAKRTSMGPGSYEEDYPQI